MTRTSGTGVSGDFHADRGTPRKDREVKAETADAPFPRALSPLTALGTQEAGSAAAHALNPGFPRAPGFVASVRVRTAKPEEEFYKKHLSQIEDTPGSGISTDRKLLPRQQCAASVMGLELRREGKGCCRKAGESKAGPGSEGALARSCACSRVVPPLRVWKEALA